MSDFLTVLAISAFAGLLTYLGAPIAERFDVPWRVVSGALQFAAGIMTALVVLTLMPPAAQYGQPAWIVLAFFIGGALQVLLEYASKRRAAGKTDDHAGASVGLYVGILVDLFIDGIVIGIGSTLTLSTGLLLAFGLAISTLPLALVTISTAKRQGMAPEKRRLLAYLLVACLIGGALIGFGPFRNASLDLRLVLVALSSGFLLTTVTQSLVPEANRDGEPSFAGILYVAGISLYSVSSLLLQ
jgi:ZIP family zinc transporter